MRLNKQFISTLFLLSISLPAFADGGICMANKKSGFNLGINALYLRANTDNLAYGILRTYPNFDNDGTSFDGRNEVIDPTYDWGFRVQVGYWFPCTCYDINLAYTNLNTIDTDSVRAPEPVDYFLSSVIVAPLTDSQLWGEEFAAASSKVEFNLNVVDLDAGRHTAGNNYDIRLFAGLRYANMNRDIYTIAESLPEESEYTANQQFKSHFKGVGPRIGAQGRYGQCCGLGLDADISAALLIGQLDSHYQGNINGIDFHRRWTAREAKNCAIPALEAKLGCDYTYRFGCKRDTLLVIEAGYQASSYLDVINTPNLNNDYDGEYTAVTSTTSNVTFNGPYLGVKYYA